MRKKKQDYHKYVFNNGKYIGDFDNMYRNCEDPWHSDQSHIHQISYDLIASVINFYKRIHKIETSKILEIGSGKGYFCNFISKFGVVAGIDISPYVVELAKQKFPELEFKVVDIKDSNIFSEGGLKKEFYDFVIMFRGMIWYTLDNIDDVLNNISLLLKKEGIAIIEVNFYKEDYYGKEIISNKDDFINLFTKNFKILNVIDYYTGEQGLNFLECSYAIIKKCN